MPIKHLTSWVLALCLMFAITGCAKPQFKKGANWTPNPRQAPTPPPVKNMPVNPALEARAAEELGRAVKSDNPIIRAHAMESLKTVGGEGSDEVIVNALNDPTAIVRFAAAMAVGEKQIVAAKPRLREMLEDDNTNVQVAVRYALHRLGDYTHSHDLESFATHPQSPVRANTAMVLGLLKEPSGLNILDGMLTDRDPAVLLAVHESRWRLGEMDGLVKLVAATQSAYPDYQIVAVQGLAGPKDQRVSEHVRAMLTAEHIEVGLAAARAMGVLGSDEGYVIAANASKDKDPRLQVLSAIALGAIGRNDAQPYLAPLLDSPDADVRLTSAAAILVLAQRS